MDNSGFFIIGIVFIGIIIVYITELKKSYNDQKRIEKQNSWKKNINNYPKHNR